MKIIHLSDFHLGIRLNEYSMYDDQRHILSEIISIIDLEQPQTVIIAGDIYDKSVPSAEAVALFDEFISELAKRNLQVLAISGNHDSAERIAFGAQIMAHSGIHFSPVYNGDIKPIVINDEYGSVNFYMIPFIKPINVRSFSGDSLITTYTDALKFIIGKLNVDRNQRNVAIVHQFITGGQQCDSEIISVGGTDNVDAEIFNAFDYTALGHLHRPQSISKSIRYCGTPLKYSFSEKDHEKSITVVELADKGSMNIRTIPLVPLRDLREIRGTYEELSYRENYKDTDTDDYIRVVLTDEMTVPNAAARLGEIYGHICELRYDNISRGESHSGLVADVENKSELELITEFYLKQTGFEMNEEQLKITEGLLDKIKEES